MSQVRGIDVSESMANEYNRRAQSLGLTSERMYATQGNLVAPSAAEPSSSALTGPDFFNFDLVIVSLGFHHFEDPGFAAKRLVERLKAGKGVLLIIDLLPHAAFKSGDGHHHGHGSAHSHASGQEYGAGHQHVSPSQAGAGESVAHQGFGQGQVVSIFQKAGCLDVDYVTLEKPIRLGDDLRGAERKVFMVRGRRGE